MSEPAEIAKVVSEMQGDLHRLGECRRLLVSTGLDEALRALFRERAMDMGRPELMAESLYFKGTPIVECNHLEGLEYAFVK